MTSNNTFGRTQSHPRSRAVAAPASWLKSSRILWSAAMCACLVFLGGCQKDVPPGSDDAARVRKNAKDLTPYEKWSYTDAIQRLKAAPSPYDATLTYYDSFVRMHQMAVQEKGRLQFAAGCPDPHTSNFGVAHANPAFLPWHRKLLITYENALREVSGRPVTLPYWDWTDPASTAATFAPDLMGGNGDPGQEYAVTDGPFRKGVFRVNLKTIIPKFQGQNPHDFIVRNFGATLPDIADNPGYPVNLPARAEVDAVFARTAYDVPYFNAFANSTQSFRAYLEGFKVPFESGQAVHNIGHDWVAGFFQVPVDSVTYTTYSLLCDVATIRNDIRVGTMEPLDVSPNDPAFFMHHVNVDRVWYAWQQFGDNMHKYADSGKPYQDRTADMYPFLLFRTVPQMSKYGIRPIDVMDSKAQLNVIYE